MKKNDRFWCWWMSRYLLFDYVTKNGQYVFRDYGDACIVLSADDVADLVRK